MSGADSSSDGAPKGILRKHGDKREDKGPLKMSEDVDSQERRWTFSFMLSVKPLPQLRKSREGRKLVRKGTQWKPHQDEEERAVNKAIYSVHSSLTLSKF